MSAEFNEAEAADAKGMAAGVTALAGAMLAVGMAAASPNPAAVTARLPNRSTICAGATGVADPDEAGLSLAEQCRRWLPETLDEHGENRATGALAALLALACRLGYWVACETPGCAVCGPLASARAALDPPLPDIEPADLDDGTDEF